MSSGTIVARHPSSPPARRSSGQPTHGPPSTRRSLSLSVSSSTTPSSSSTSDDVSDDDYVFVDIGADDLGSSSVLSRRHSAALTPPQGAAAASAGAAVAEDDATTVAKHHRRGERTAQCVSIALLALTAIALVIALRWSDLMYETFPLSVVQLSDMMTPRTNETLSSSSTSTGSEEDTVTPSAGDKQQPFDGDAHFGFAAAELCVKYPVSVCIALPHDDLSCGYTGRLHRAEFVTFAALVTVVLTAIAKTIEFASRRSVPSVFHAVALVASFCMTVAANLVLLTIQKLIRYGPQARCTTSEYEALHRAHDYGIGTSWVFLILASCLLAVNGLLLAFVVCTTLSTDVAPEDRRSRLHNPSSSSPSMMEEADEEAGEAHFELAVRGLEDPTIGAAPASPTGGEAAEEQQQEQNKTNLTPSTL